MKEKIEKFAMLCAAFSIIFSVYYFIGADSRKEKMINEARAKMRIESENKIEKQLTQKLGAAYLDMEKYSAWASRFKLALKDNSLNEDPDKDGLRNYLEYLHGTNPNKADTDGDGFSEKSELQNGFDPDDDGKSNLQVQIKIEKLGIDAPMVWSKSTSDAEMLKDLENGVSHFHKTASPGQIGNMIVSGHSSNYSWARGDYNNIFKDLYLLETGDEIIVNTLQKNGRAVAYKYSVIKKFVTTADDQQVFAQSEKPILTLSTCWPLGTNLKRLIVKAEIEN
ncbi:MAG: sortase family protein [uncultured bacterium]|nr:MAG: sortase family protein [uncultured bacterium]